MSIDEPSHRQVTERIVFRGTTSDGRQVEDVRWEQRVPLTDAAGRTTTETLLVRVLRVMTPDGQPVVREAIAFPVGDLPERVTVAYDETDAFGLSVYRDVGLHFRGRPLKQPATQGGPPIGAHASDWSRGAGFDPQLPADTRAVALTRVGDAVVLDCLPSGLRILCMFDPTAHQIRWWVFRPWVPR